MGSNEETQLATFKIEKDVWQKYLEHSKKNGVPGTRRLIHFIYRVVDLADSGNDWLYPESETGLTYQLDEMENRVYEAMEHRIQELEERLARLEKTQTRPNLYKSRFPRPVISDGSP